MEEQPEIMAVVFDIGNVIQKSELEKIVAMYKPKEGGTSSSVSLKEMFFGYSKGELQQPQFHDYLCQKLKMEANEQNRKMVERIIYETWCPPDSGVVQIIRDLKPGIKKGIFSNCCPEQEANARSYSAEQNGYLHLFNDGIKEIVQGFTDDGSTSALLSHKIGSAKPEIRAYEFAESALGVEYRNILFIDDNMDFLEAAQRLGMHIQQFSLQTQDAAVLKKHLQAYGVMKMQ